MSTGLAFVLSVSCSLSQEGSRATIRGRNDSKECQARRGWARKTDITAILKIYQAVLWTFKSDHCTQLRSMFVGTDSLYGGAGNCVSKSHNLDKDSSGFGLAPTTKSTNSMDVRHGCKLATSTDNHGSGRQQWADFLEQNKNTNPYKTLHIASYKSLLYKLYEVITVDNGRLLATEYKPPYVSDIHGPLRPKKVFSISINKSKNRTEILCLHGYGEAHPGSIEFETEESDVVFKCCQMSSHAHPKGSSVELSTMIKEATNNHTIPFTIDDQKRLECYMKNVQKYRLTRIEVQRPDPVYPIQPGLFLAHYSAHGIEMFLLKYDMSKKEAEVIKITGDPNVPAGETSIYINLRKPMQLTKDQQLDVNSLLLLEEEDIPESDDVQPRNQPFVIPPGFSTFLDDFTPTTCEYR
ncbi:F-box protein 31 [Mytilus galloprovincialis]|uniref:F-box protein 31 n=1 Tax=Mytilus galloprovincialis TaxID=29158 RepID=A0A8B6D1K5_MYTGA|nr:F-box protein 31 [Mytilus galloprovincialis]